MLFLTKDYVDKLHHFHFHDNCRCYHKYNHYRDPLDHSVMVREMEALRKIGRHFQHQQHSNTKTNINTKNGVLQTQVTLLPIA